MDREITLLGRECSSNRFVQAQGEGWNVVKVCVFGLWHLGCVTAACLARAGHDVVALDPDAALIGRLRQAQLPLFEPGLEALVREGMAAGRLRFESDPAQAVAQVELLWVTFDTPVDEDDNPQVDAVIEPVSALVKALPHGCLVLISSQLPVRSTRRLAAAAAQRGSPRITFGYSPENLRLGKAIDVFTNPDRVVVGLQQDADRDKVAALLAPFSSNILWMGLEAAEMTKHAINAFLGTSVAFMNEIAALCEQVGADAKDVERGLKSEARIGPKAYLSPGGAFAGGTLARDLRTLSDVAHDCDTPLELIESVLRSNRQHRSWALRKITEKLGDLRGRHIAILGLTYKPGTSTLRNSGAVELAQALCAQGAQVAAFDPAVPVLPAELARQFDLALTADHAVKGADALVLCTAWPEFLDLDWGALCADMARPLVLDANWFLAGRLRGQPNISYAAVGLQPG
jgi:UDPglucose 6-dehydrogenase